MWYMYSMPRKMPKVCNECPFSTTTKLVGDFWLLLIIRTLITSSPLRFTELADTLVGISRRTLTLKLKLAEHEGLITRTEYAEHPPRVEYTITSYGKKLKPVLAAINTFSKQ